MLTMSDERATNPYMHAGLHLPYGQMVEDLLGLPLLPTTEYQTPIGGGPEDMREIAHRVVVGVVRQCLLEGGERGTMPPPEEASRFLLPQQHVSLVRGQHGETLQAVKRQVAVANNVFRSFEVPDVLPEGADEAANPRVQRQHRTRGVLNLLTQRPKPAQIPVEKPHPLDPLRGGIVVVAPPGSGKTVMNADYLRRAGIGKPIAPNDPEILRALVVVSDRAAMRQMRGLIGNKTFLRWLGLQEEDIGAYSMDVKDLGHSLDLLSKFIARRALERQALRLQDYAIKSIDEGHALLEPRLLSMLSDLGTRALLFTATPQLQKDRDVRRYLPDHVVGSLRGSVEQGALRPAILMTCLYGSEENAATDLATQINLHFISQGKKVITFCQSGDGSAQGTDIAAAINAAAGHIPNTEEGQELAAAPSQRLTNRQNTDALTAFDKNRLQALCLTKIGQEAMDTEVEVVVVIGPRWAPRAFTQMIGRGMHSQVPPHMAKPVVLIELLPSEVPQGRAPLRTLWHEFDLGHGSITQGLYIGRRDDADIGAPERDGTSTPRSRATSSGTADHQLSGQPDAAEDMLVPDISTMLEDLKLPDAILRHLAPPKPVRSIIVGTPEQRLYAPPPGRISSTVLAQEHEVPLGWLDRQLDRAGIPWDGVWPDPRAYDDDDPRILEYERWYDEEKVAAFLKDNPMPQQIEGVALSVAQIAEDFGISVSHATRIINEVGAEAIPTLTKGNLRMKKYPMSEIRKVAGKVNEIPLAAETDVPVSNLAGNRAFSTVYKYLRAHKAEYNPQEKRRHPAHGIAGYAYHITEEHARELRILLDTPVATTAHIGVSEIAERAGVNLGVAVRAVGRIKDEDPARVISLRPNENLAPRDHMLRAEGLDLARQIKPVQLTPRHITRTFLFDYFGASRSGIIKAAQRVMTQAGLEGAVLLESVVLNLGGGGGEEVCYPWVVPQRMERAGIPLRDASHRLDYSRLGVDQQPLDWDYARQVQARVIPEERLALPPTLNEVRQMLHCQPWALQHVLNLINPTDADLRRGEGGVARPRFSLMPAIQSRIRTARAVRVDPSWSSYGQLAQRLKMTHNQLFKYLQARHLNSTEMLLGVHGGRDEQIDLWFSPTFCARTEYDLTR